MRWPERERALGSRDAGFELPLLCKRRDHTELIQDIQAWADSSQRKDQGTIKG